MAKTAKEKFEAKAARQNLGVEVRLTSAIDQVQKQIEEKGTTSLSKAAFFVMRQAQASIKTSAEPSDPGEPPTTRGRGRKSLRAAIQYAVDGKENEAVIGPSKQNVGPTGKHHEFGIPRKTSKFVERPFMGPALEESLDRFVGQFKSSLVS